LEEKEKFSKLGKLDGDCEKQNGEGRLRVRDGCLKDNTL
jgi:hypothetical protein